VKAAPFLTTAVFVFTLGTIPAQAQDDYDLLPEGDGKDVTYAICSGCHSIRLVVQQGLSRKAWEKNLKWMVEEQGMPELDEETYSIILEYLAENLDTDHRPPWLEESN
jgi:hypothetical protein